MSFQHTQQEFYFKLVSQEYTTKNKTLWEIGKTNTVSVPGAKLCTNQLLHCYADPRIAVIFNPRHANIYNPRLLKIKCSEILAADAFKFGCKEQTPVEELALPKISLSQKIAFGIKCAMEVYKGKKFTIWANNWLSGVDRAKNTAAAYAVYAYAAAAANANANAAAAANAAANANANANANAAADAAAYAADAAAYAAAYAAANAAAYAAAYAADAAAYADADAAAYADAAASKTQNSAFDPISILNWVVQNIK